MTSIGHLPPRRFPRSAGLLFGLGLGGFFDGIVLHQLFQRHHMVSPWYPIDTIEKLELHTFWDGAFHSGANLFVHAALFILWRSPPAQSLQVVDTRPRLDDADRLWSIQCSGCITSTRPLIAMGGFSGTSVSLRGAGNGGIRHPDAGAST